MSASADSARIHRLGVISDTHGRLDYRVATAFSGVERVVHAGDVGKPFVLWELQTIAPVLAVEGNVDRWELQSEELPAIARLEVAGARIVVAHVRSDIPADLAEKSDVVIFGHSHMPFVEEIAGVLWVNPGSASQPRRSAIGRSVAILELKSGDRPTAHIVALNDYGEQL